MKKFLLCLAALPTLAYGKGIAYMENDGGGRIIITNEVCYNKERTKTYDGVYRIYTYSAKGSTTEGCFMFEDETVRVFWPEHKKESRYPIKDFIMLESK